MHQSDEILLADFTAEETSFIENSVERALKKIYTGTYKGEFPDEFWAITAGKLNEAVDSEFGKDYKPLANKLKYQNGVFAAFKSQNQTQTLENLLKASKAATFTDFAQEVQSTVKDYNINHLKAEWNTAKMACRSAKRWAKAVEDADLFPNIEYTPSTAIDPRDIHKPYYGMILSMDDQLLDSILPPSIWGCQCGWRTTDKAVTKAPKGVPPPSPGLDNNPGKDGALFSQSHPYFKAKGAEDIVRNDLALMEKVEIDEIKIHSFDKKSKGVIYSTGQLNDNAIKANIITGEYHANSGSMVKLINVDVSPSGKYLKTPDAIVDGWYNEFKMSGKKNPSINNISADIQDSSEKGKRLNAKIDITLRYVDAEKEHVKNAFIVKEAKKHIEYVENTWIINNEKMFGPFTKKQILEGKFDIK